MLHYRTVFSLMQLTVSDYCLKSRKYDSWAFYCHASPNFVSNGFFEASVAVTHFVPPTNEISNKHYCLALVFAYFRTLCLEKCLAKLLYFSNTLLLCT